MRRLSWLSPVVSSVLAASGLACWSEPNPELLVLAKAPSGWAQNRILLPRVPVVRLTRADGSPVEYAGVEVTAAITAGGGALLGRTAVRTDTTGAATFEDLSISGTVGEKTLTFSSFGLPGARSSINLTAGVPARLALHYGDNQSTAAGTMLVRAPSVMVVDMDGNPVAGVLVTFGVLSGGGSVTAAHPRSDTAGVATVGSWRLGPAIGTHTLIARAEPIGSVTFTAHGH